MHIDDWPNCPTPDCENKVCLWANTGRCYQCSGHKLGSHYMDELYNKTHDKDGFLNSNIEGIDDGIN